MSFSRPLDSSTSSVSLPPLWKDEALKALNLRQQGGFAHQFERQSWQGRFTVKLGLTILIPQALPRQTMTCLDAAREALSERDIAQSILASLKCKGAREEDYYWACEELYKKYPLDIFLRILETLYALVWGMAREKLVARGFQSLPIHFKCRKTKLHSLSDLVAAYPASPSPRTPFVVDKQSIRIRIPALPPPSNTSTSLTTLSIDVEDIPDIPYETLTDEERSDLRDHLVRVAKTTIQRANLDNGGWDPLGIDSEQHEFDMSPKELQSQAWVGDAGLHKLSREVLIEVEPALPLGCIKAVAKTFNSNSVQSEFPRSCGLYKDPSRLSKIEADHWGGTFVEGGFSIPYQTHVCKNRELPKEWVRKDLKLVAPAMVQGYKDFFAARKRKSQDTNLKSDKQAAASSSSSIATSSQHRITKNPDPTTSSVSSPSLLSRLGSLPPSPSSGSICTTSGPSTSSSLSLLERLGPPPLMSSESSSSASGSLLRRIAPLPSRSRGHAHGSDSAAVSYTPSNRLIQQPVVHGTSIQRKAGTSSSTASTNNASPPPPRGMKRVLRDVDPNVERPRKAHSNGKERLEGSGYRGRW